MRKKSPRVLFSANTSWYLYNYYRNTFRAFLNAGYDVVLASPPDVYADKLREMGCTCVPLAIRPNSKNLFYELYTLLQFFKIYRVWRPDAVFHFTIKCNLYGSQAARLLGIPHVNSISGLGSAFSKPAPFDIFFQGLYRLTQRKSARVFFQNTSDRDFMIRHGMVSVRQAFLLPGSGVDLNHFRPLSKKAATPFVFVFAGRIIWEKGLTFLAAAMRTLKKQGAAVECRVYGFLEAGNGKYLPRALLAQWEAEGLLRYMGPLEDVRQAYDQADCVVLPTYYGEGVPKSLLEAAAMARPMVATDLPGCRQAVRDGENGFLCAPRDAGSLAAAMLRMAELDDEARARLGRRGREIVEAGFSEIIVTRAFLQTAGDLVGRAFDETGSLPSLKMSEPARS